MTEFLKIGRWTFNLANIVRFYDSLPDENVVDVDTAIYEGSIILRDENAESFREFFTRHNVNIKVFDITPVPATEDSPL